MLKILKSPCLSCVNGEEDKDKCVDDCEKIRKYLNELGESEKIFVISEKEKKAGKTHPLSGTTSGGFGGKTFTSPPKHILDEQ